MLQIDDERRIEKENNKERLTNNIFLKNEESIRVSIKKWIVKMNNCTFWLGRIPLTAGDALRTFPMEERQMTLFI